MTQKFHWLPSYATKVDREGKVQGSSPADCCAKFEHARALLVLKPMKTKADLELENKDLAESKMYKNV